MWFPGCILGCLLLCSCGSKEQPATASPGTAQATNAPVAAATAPRPETARLAGKWERADGDYTIEIKSVASDGKLEASYYNPSPIHVSRALAASEQGGVKVFIELQDVNYPGCTYSLKYDPAADQLYGTYFQAAVQETYDVTFARK